MKSHKQADVCSILLLHRHKKTSAVDSKTHESQDIVFKRDILKAFQATLCCNRQGCTDEKAKEELPVFA